MTETNMKECLTSRHATVGFIPASASTAHFASHNSYFRFHYQTEL